jgi:hypothetical protein
MQAFSGHTHPDAIACCLVHVSAQAGLQGGVFGCLFIQVPTLFFACAARSHAHASLLLGFSFFGLVHFPIPTHSSYIHHIKSFDACIEH